MQESSQNMKNCALNTLVAFLFGCLYGKNPDSPVSALAHGFTEIRRKICLLAVAGVNARLLESEVDPAHCRLCLSPAAHNRLEHQYSFYKNWCFLSDVRCVHCWRIPTAGVWLNFARRNPQTRNLPGPHEILTLFGNTEKRVENLSLPPRPFGVYPALQHEGNTAVLALHDSDRADRVGQTKAVLQQRYRDSLNRQEAIGTAMRDLTRLRESARTDEDFLRHQLKLIGVDVEDDRDTQVYTSEEEDTSEEDESEYNDETDIMWNLDDYLLDDYFKGSEKKRKAEDLSLDGRKRRKK